MEKLSFEQIKEIINQIDELDDWSPSMWMAGEYPVVDAVDTEELKGLIRQLGEFKLVDRYGGEGKGDQYWKVYHFIDHEVYIQFDGWYASHSGSEYEQMFEVTPTEVMEIEWVRKEK